LKSVNAINTSDIVISLLEQINKLLLSLKNEKNLLRYEIVEHLFGKVNIDNKGRIDIEDWKTLILKEISVQDDLFAIVRDFIIVITKECIFLSNNSLYECNELKKELVDKEDIISVVTWIKIQLEKHWDSFKNDHVNKKIIDQFIKETLFKFIESKYKNVGYLVKQVLNNMDDKSLNNFIKQKAGNDLHGIRLNGCIIGALFGGIVFIVTRLLYGLILPSLFGFKF